MKIHLVELHYIGLPILGIIKFNEKKQKDKYIFYTISTENAALFLISWGADINKQDKEIGMTPLHLSSISGSVKIAKKLLIKGADRTIKDT